MHVFCMKRTAATLLLLLFVAAATAQSYIGYHRTVAGAEEALVNKRFTEALRNYDSAFAAYPFNNPVDVYVAAQVAAYLGDTDRCKAYIRRGLSFGLPLQTAIVNPHLAGYLPALLPHRIDSCREVYLKRINKKARKAALALAKKDQDIVHVAGTIYGPDGYTLKPQYVPAWDSMLTEVIGITRTYGFPAQKIIGTQKGDDNIFTPGPHSVFVYYILIHHGNAWPQLKDLLPAELEKGNITPQMYAAIADNSAGHNDYGKMRYFALRPCDQKACKQTVSHNKAAIDAARAEIGLCSYDVMCKKYASTIAHKKWKTKKSQKPKPVFDFCPDLHFMGSK